MEEELLQKLLRGDQSGYKYIFDTYYKVLTNFAHRIVKDTETAKDVVQNVIIKIYNNRDHLKGVKEIKYYLYTCVYRECLNELKKQNIREIHQHQYASFQETIFI